jgi:hypothetical protein
VWAFLSDETNRRLLNLPAPDELEYGKALKELRVAATAFLEPA